MTWFYCDGCGDSIKKPKVEAHARSCGSSKFTCIDCSVSFNLHTVKGHTTCVTEHEKYALAATKPGGYAANGFPGSASGGGGAGGTKSGSGEAVGLEFLTKKAPWKCTICNVNCTSYETLMGHAQGTKHVRRSRAAQRAKEEGDKGGEGKEEGQAPAAEKEEKEEKREETEKAAGTSNGADEKESGKDKATAGKKVKWKSLAKAALKKKDGRMKLKKLIKALLAEAGVEAGEEEVLAKLRKSGKFVIEGETVSLKA